MKVVTYFNIEVHVPATIHFIATDESGKFLGYEEEPVADLELKFWDSPNGLDMYELGVLDLEGKDWTTTLQAV
jgi:hypothetical protein